MLIGSWKKESFFKLRSEQSLWEFDIVRSFEVRQSLDQAWNVKDLQLVDIFQNLHPQTLKWPNGANVT